METPLQFAFFEKSSLEPSPITKSEVLTKALEFGWDDAGVTKAEISPADIDAYREWIAASRHAKLEYMENEIRCLPQALLPNAKSAILFVSYYKQPSIPIETNKGIIAAYARGRDYHNVHRKRIKKFVKWLEERSGLTGIARGFSDSAPIMEKALAVQAGLGWFGKNTLLIHRKFGTYILLSVVLTTLEITDAVMELRLPRCGSCNKCLEACPTQALIAPYTLDAARCLSYHLIESKEEIPEEIQKKNPGYIFGCDICQEACPHNWKKSPSARDDFAPEAGIGAELTWEQLLTLNEDPASLFGTPLQRRGLEGLKYSAQTLGLDAKKDAFL